MASVRVKLVFGCLALSLSACTMLKDKGVQPQESVERPSESVTTRQPNETATDLFNTGTNAPQESAPFPDPELAIVRGTGVFVHVEGTQSSALDELGDAPVSLNFVNADIRDVVRSVFAQALGLTYVIDPQVTGNVTFQSAKPLPKNTVLPALESVLSLNGVAIVLSNGIYNVVPAKDARQLGAEFRYTSSPGASRPGYRFQIVPLRYITANEMREILDPFAPAGSIVRVDAKRNFIILAGTQAEVSALLETISIFDVDIMEGMSFALFAINWAESDELSKEIGDIFRSIDSPAAQLVELISIPRINSILAVSPQPDYLISVADWIKKLDGQTERGAGQRLFYYRLQNSKAEDIADTLSSILDLDLENLESDAATQRRNTNSGTKNKPQAKIVADVQNNALIILASPAEHELIKTAIERMDITPDQVFIEGTIVEVTLTDELKYGVQWFFSQGNNTFTQSDVSSGAITSKFPGFSYTYFVSDTRIALNALSSVTDVEVISSPKIMTLNNQAAILQVGDQVPVATQSAVSITNPDAPIVNTVQFRDTGVILEVTPRINNGGGVILEISLEVSDVAETTTSGIDSPTIQQRKISSTVTVQNGQTIALGGLIRDNRSKSKSGVPLLSKIPILGIPFRATSKNHRRTELLIFITPRIVRSMEDARSITDYLRDKLPALNRLRDEIVH